MPDLALTGRRILVVEDEYIIATEVKTWLELAGAEVVGPVPDVGQALNLIEVGGLDAAVLDIDLGYGDTVFPVADKLGAIGIPYLFATGDTRLASTSIPQPRQCLVKPYVEADLVGAVVKLIDWPWSR